MSRRVRGFRGAAAALGLSLALAPAAASAQTHGAVQTRRVDPSYPDNLLKTGRQGNVLLLGRIDTKGRLRDLVVITASHQDFAAPALEAVKQWEFRPATRDGQPVEVFANVVVRFRIQNDQRGVIDAPIVGDVAISPADASGRVTAPEGFPIQKGRDPAFRAEVLLDVPADAQARTLAVRVEALSPKAKSYPIFQSPVPVPAGAKEVKFPIVVKIGNDWEDGVWILRMTLDGQNVGVGQFWLAKDPAHFAFVVPKP